MARAKTTRATRTKPPIKKKPKARHKFAVVAKTPGQKAYIQNIKDNVVTLCSGFAGTGKAQPIDARVLTPTGWKLMGRIKVGDDVLTPNGDSVKVMGVFPQGELEIYQVKFSDGTSTECCADHLWQTKTSIERDNKKSGNIRTTREIMETLHYNGKRNHSIPMTKPVEFNKRQLKLDPYLLGILIGDGCFSQNAVMLSTVDSFIVESACESSASLGLILKKKSGENCDYNFIKAGNADWRIKNPLISILDDLQLMGKKSYEKSVPLKYKFTTSEDRLGLLQGLMDSDGTISNKKGYSDISFSSTSSALATDVKFLVESFGGKATITERTTSFTYKEIKKQGRRSFRVNISMPPEINPFRLPRKASQYIPRTKKPTRYIDSIKLVGKKLAQCILINSEDHLYLTNNFIVTHNTLIAIGMAMQLVQDGETNYSKIVVVRPAVEACGEQIGFLPGGLADKMKPLIQPIMDNLRFFISDEGHIGNLLEPTSGHGAPLIEVIPMAYLRGRTFNNCVVVFDEAQNASPSQMKLFLTRIGKNCKVIIEGDVTQSDKYKRRDANGLADAIKRLQDCENVGISILEARDIQRSEIIGPILERYSDVDGI